MLLGGAGRGAYWEWRATVREIYRTQGAGGGFVRGLGPCLLRALAFPVNAAIFLPYEMCMKSRIPCHDDP